MRKIESDGMKSAIKRVKGIMRSCGLHNNAIEMIMLELVNFALYESVDMKYERIYTAAALAGNEEFGWGQKRIGRFLKEFSRQMERTDEESWTDLMQELDDKTGVVIRMGDEENRLVMEYHGDSYLRHKQIEKAEKETRDGRDQNDQ